MNKATSKYFSTASRMDEALLECLEKKDFAYITVIEQIIDVCMRCIIPGSKEFPNRERHF